MATLNPFTGNAAALSEIPVELQPQFQQSNRQQQMANLLLQQGLSGQPQGQMVSGHYVKPSWAQQLAPVANQALAMYAGYQADKGQTDLAAALRQRKAEDVQSYMEAMSPVAAKEGGIAGPNGQMTTQTTADMYGPNMELNPQYKQVAAVQGRGPDYTKAFQVAYNSYDPALRAQALDMIKSETLPEGATKGRMNLSTGKWEAYAQGGPKTSNDIKYAIAVGGLPSDYSTWTPAQQKFAQNLIKDKEASGAARYDFANMLGKSTINQIGPMLELSKGGAIDAIDTANAATRVLGALDTGKALTGPSANQRLAVNQVGQMLGISGTNEEVATQTRSVIQNLAKLTLQGRKQMRGQGAVSETEGALAEKAESGNINFTRAEIKQLADAALRTSKWKYQQHENMMTPLREDEPKASRYYEVPVNPSIFEPPKPKTVGTSSVVNDALSIVRGTSGASQ
jgi:hypothetical protein